MIAILIILSCQDSQGSDTHGEDRGWYKGTQVATMDSYTIHAAKNSTIWEYCQIPPFRGKLPREKKWILHVIKTSDLSFKTLNM